MTRTKMRKLDFSTIEATSKWNELGPSIQPIASRKQIGLLDSQIAVD